MLQSSESTKVSFCVLGKRSKPQVQLLECWWWPPEDDSCRGDGRYIILQTKRGRRQSASIIAQQLSTATGRQVSRFTVARRLHKGGLFARCPERCLPLKVDHRRHRLQWCRDYKNWRIDQWSCVLFTDESRFSTRSDSQRVLIWREIGTRFYTSNIKERHTVVLVPGEYYAERACEWGVALFSCTRAFGDGPRNFEPWSTTWTATPSLTTTPHQWEDVSAPTDLACIAALHGGSLGSVIGDPMPIPLGYRGLHAERAN
ncbi:transposable element Tcb2 transposase [Trichonephila clavipes]|nr:transposable element Tcb2 transposase [Trichonephila clavipes]